MVAKLFTLRTSSLWRRSYFTGWQLPDPAAQKVAALAGVAAAQLRSRPCSRW